MRVRAVAGLGLIALGLMVIAVGWAVTADDPSAVVGRSIAGVLAVLVLAAGLRLWHTRNGGTPESRQRDRMIGAAVAGVWLLSVGAVTGASGDAVGAASALFFAVIAFGYIVLLVNSPAADVITTTLILPAGPEAGLLVVAPRSKQLVWVVGAFSGGACLAVIAMSADADPGARLLMGLLASVLLFVASPWYALRMRRTVGLGISASGVSFVQNGHVLLVPWAHLDRVEAFRLRTGRGGSLRVVGVYIDDPQNLMGSARVLRRLVRLAPAGSPVLTLPVTMFDLEGDEIVDLVRRHQRHAAARGDLGNGDEQSRATPEAP